jgi:hypothetical protein
MKIPETDQDRLSTVLRSWSTNEKADIHVYARAGQAE